MICVYSEIAELKKVLVHRPGRELKYVTPRRLDELLFAQMLDLPRAQSEHDMFTSILRQQGVEVVYLVDLLIATYELCDDSAKL